MIGLGYDALTEQYHGEDWRTRHAYSTTFLKAPQHENDDVLNAIEERISRLTMIPSHSDESRLMFTRQLPGFPPGMDLDNQALRNVHHDKNQRENRVVSVIVYLTTARQHDGGHTLFPCLPRQAAGGAPPSETAQQMADGLAAQFQELFENGTRIVKADGQYPSPAAFNALNECNRQCAMADNAQVLSIWPKRGMAVVVWHVHPDGRPNHAVVSDSVAGPCDHGIVVH